MAGMTKAQIEARLAAVEAENARLRAVEDDNRSLRDELAAASAARDERSPEVAAPRRRTRGRAFLGMTLIVIATLLAPMATVVSFTARQASDTPSFVRTLAPLADEPAVKALIVDRAARAIDEALDPDALVADLLDKVIDADATPRLARASDLLGPLLADQARVAIRSALGTVVESDAFATVWEQALQLTHRQLLAAIEANPDGAVEISDSGVVAIQLGPIIAALKPALVEAGFTLADSIPEVSASITVAELPSIARARLGYSALTTVGDVLPWIALVLLVIGIVVHPRRPRAVVVAGTLILVTGAAVGGAIVIGGSITAAAIAAQVPTDATDAIYRSLTGESGAAMLAYVVLGAVAVTAGLIAGGSDGAVALRRSGGALLARGSAALDNRGWRPDGLPAVLRRQGWLLWLWLGALLLIMFATMRPLTVSDVIVVTIVLGLAAALYGVLAGTSEPTTTPEEAQAAEHAITT
ncbi:hypothetical protein [Demequina sp.]|uniref:hypothetical protein n=1 Tax=Demequina sp. TaxID=2050685 RepID=UPI0025CD6EEB|nr:hypothetical protein [Demequina sp.]